MHDVKREPTDKLSDRVSDATSDETLSDIEDDQTETHNGGKQNEVPNPDSTSVDRREKQDDAGPM